jgi:hypothetical protein
MIKYEGTQF